MSPVEIGPGIEAEVKSAEKKEEQIRRKRRNRRVLIS
jgi:hypothetical protein